MANSHNDKSNTTQAGQSPVVRQRRRGRTATGARPRLILTIPPELDEALTELADRFNIAKSTLVEKHAVLPALANLVGFANWARDAAPERDVDPDLWGRARWALMESGPEPLDVALEYVKGGLNPGGVRGRPITQAQLDEDEVRELKELLQQFRRRNRA